MKAIIYIAHPVTGDPINNAHNAVDWVKWFAQHDSTRIYIAPWVAEVLGFADEELPDSFYQAVIDDDCEVVNRLDGLVGVGGKWSTGMLQERASAKASQYKAVLDMTMYRSPKDVPEYFDLQRAWANYVEPY